MKTLLSPGDRNEILDRLAKVYPDSPPCWGTMSAHQMVCHLSDSFRASLKEKYISPSSTFLKRTLLKWVALWVPLQWPRGIKTRPEMDQRKGGTHPRSLHPIWGRSAFFLSASVVRRASSLLTRCSVRCRGKNACATPISTWTIICGSLALREKIEACNRERGQLSNTSKKGRTGLKKIRRDEYFAWHCFRLIPASCSFASSAF